MQIIRLQNNYLIAAIVIFIGITYLFRPISYDDAFFMEQSYWLYKLGYVKTVLFDGLLDWSVREFVYHKLHIWQGSVLISAFGINVHILKLLPLLYLALFIFVSWRYFNKYFSNKNSFLFFTFLLLAHTFVIQFSLEFRPEIMMMCTGFISFYFLRTSSNNHTLIYGLAGIFSGITALFHLNGLIFISAGFFLLLYEKNYKAIAAFFTGAILAFSPYFYEMMSIERLERFYYQFTNDPAITKEDLSPAQWTLKILSGPLRFFEHGYESFYTIFAATVLWLNRKNITQNSELKILLIYFLILEVSLSLISPGSKSMYLIYHLPYILIAVAASYPHSKSRTKNKFTLPILLFLYVTSQLLHIYSISSKPTSDPELHAHLLEKHQIQPSDKILAPEQFIFNQIENAEIRGVHVYDLLRLRHNFDFNMENVFGDAYKNNMRFIFLYERYVKHHINQSFSVGDVFHGYIFLGKEENIYTFKKSSS